MEDKITYLQLRQHLVHPLHLLGRRQNRPLPRGPPVQQRGRRPGRRSGRSLESKLDEYRPECRISSVETHDPAAPASRSPGLPLCCMEDLQWSEGGRRGEATRMSGKDFRRR